MPPLPQQPLQGLADALKRARKERPQGRQTQEKVAEDVRQATDRDLTAGAISQIETGRIRPEVETVEALAVVLGEHLLDTPEYRLALARRNLDERIVGLEAALANLEVPPAALLPRRRSPQEIVEAAVQRRGDTRPSAPRDRPGKRGKGQAA